MARRPRIHNLRRNDAERSPRRLLFVDTESTWAVEDKRELHQLRLWAGLLVTRTPGSPGTEQLTPFWGRTATELGDLVSSNVKTAATTWVYTHNLSFDLALTRLPLELIRRGWQLGQHNLASDSPWARLKRKNYRLRLADSVSWLPVPVKTLGELMGLPKPELPADEDTEELWLARCQADVAITALAMVRLMNEWDRLQLGHWSLTGAATGWNAFLHMTPRRNHPRPVVWPLSGAGRSGAEPAAPVVIDPDPQARQFEREAIYSGRRDVWRWGELPGEHYAELDFRAAHATICAGLPLPDRRARRFDGMELDDWRWENRTRTMIARCRVRTETARYPLRWRGQVLHPVGEFETTLAGPELRDARSRGELLSVGAGYSYQQGRFMRAWAEWVLAVLYPEAVTVDPILQTAVKAWSRKVPGRWGMQVSREQARRPSPNLGWGLEAAAFGYPPRQGHLLTIAGEQVELVKDQEPDDSFPAILAHVQSWARLLQGRMIEFLGEANVVQVNTDSALVKAARLKELARERFERRGAEPGDGGELAAGALEVSAVTAPLEARLKAVGRGGTVLSAQHVEHAGRRKFSGVPAAAEQVEPGVWEFWTWPKLKGQLERGDPRGYVRELRRVDLRGLTVNRWRYADGCCEPVRAAWSPDSGNVLLPPAPGGCSAHGAALSELQHRSLRPLL